MVCANLRGVSIQLISLYTLVLFLISGCGKSPTTDDEEWIREASIAFCERLLENPRLSEDAKSRTASVLQKRKDNYVDAEPILMRALLVEVEWRERIYLVVELSDEDGDIAGIGVRERHVEPNGQTIIIEELYPVFCYESLPLACSLSIPVIIRKNGERKNEQFWQKYLDRGVCDTKLMPNFWVPTPQPGKVEVEIWIYDRSGHKSEPVPLYSLIRHDPNDPND